MKSEKILFYFLFIFKKVAIFFVLALFFFPLLNTVLEIIINKNATNFWTIYSTSLTNFVTMNYSQLKSSEIQIAQLHPQQLFFSFFGQSFWLLLTILVPAFFMSFMIGIRLALNADNKKMQFINGFVRWLNLLPAFLLIPLVIIIFVKLGQNTTFISLAEVNFWISFQSFIPLWISLFLPICLLLIVIIKNIALKHIKSDYYIMVLTTGKSKTHLIFKVILKNTILDLLPYLMGIYALALSFSIVAERSFGFNGQSFILNFAFNRGEVSLIVFALFFNIAFIYAIQVFLKLILILISPLEQEIPNSKYDIIKRLKKHKIRELNVEKGVKLES